MATVPKGEDTKGVTLPTGAPTKLSQPPGASVTSNVPALPNTSKPPQFTPAPSSWKVDIKEIMAYVTEIQSKQGEVEAQKVIAWLNKKRG